MSPDSPCIVRIGDRWRDVTFDGETLRSRSDSAGVGVRIGIASAVVWRECDPASRLGDISESGGSDKEDGVISLVTWRECDGSTGVCSLSLSDSRLPLPSSSCFKEVPIVPSTGCGVIAGTFSAVNCRECVGVSPSSNACPLMPNPIGFPSSLFALESLLDGLSDPLDEERTDSVASSNASYN